MGKICELEAKNPARSRRSASPVLLVLGVFAAFCGALVLSALFAHPAGASTLPGPGGTPPVAAISNVVPPAVSALPAASDSDAQASVAAAATPVNSLTAVVPVTTLTHLVEPIAQSLGSTIDSAVRPPAAAPTVVSRTALQLAAAAAASHAAPATRLLRTKSDTSGNLPMVSLVPSSPTPISPPSLPYQKLILALGGSSTSDSSLSSSGSSALSVVPASGQLPPAQMVSGIAPEQSALPRFLFDERSSPPG